MIYFTLSSATEKEGRKRKIETLIATNLFFKKRFPATAKGKEIEKAALQLKMENKTDNASEELERYREIRSAGLLCTKLGPPRRS